LVAIKVLLNFLADPEMLRRFQREAIITADLQHLASIVQRS